MADLSVYVGIAQVISTILTGIGIIISIWIAITTLREMRSERIHRVKPKVLFVKGGQLVLGERVEARGIPGINPAYAKEILANKPKNAKAIHAKTFWGRLKNLGEGSAINVEITFIFYYVIKSGERFELNSKKRKEPPYSEWLNTIPASPSNLSKGETAIFGRLPTPIVLDFSRQINMLEGKVCINYEDIYGNKYEIDQESRVFVNHKRNKIEITMTFGEEILDIPKNSIKKSLT